MNFFTARTAALTLIIVLLTGCAGRSPTLLDPAREIPLKNLQHWQLNARIAITTPSDNATASLKWKKKNSEFDFLVSGPLGVTVAHLVQEKKQAYLSIPDEEKRQHENAHVLLQQSLGWDFPIEALAFWVKGIPSGKAGEQVSYNEKGQIDSISLADWQVDFSKYRRFQGYVVPKMIKAVHPQMSIKVVAKRWQFFE